MRWFPRFACALSLILALVATVGAVCAAADPLRLGWRALVSASFVLMAIGGFLAFGLWYREAR